MFLRIKKPDDWHLHLRDGDILQDIVLSSAKNFCRVVVMPNLSPPIENVEQALKYRDRIDQAVKSALRRAKIEIKPKEYEILEREVQDFSPQMTLFLNESIDAKEINLLAETKDLLGVKLYPSNATTNSKGGVQNIESFYPIFERMEEKGVPLLIHGESGSKDIDVFEREQSFISDSLTPILQHFPKLKMTLEHISTAAAVDFVAEKSQKHPIAATITVHHLLLDRNDLLADGLKPHYYCKPLVKTLADKKALIQAAISGKSCFFLGTDSAPHAVSAKENCCGAAGIFSAPYALVLLASLFERENALDSGALESFCSVYGAQHYGFPVTKKNVVLEKVDEEEITRKMGLNLKEENSLIYNPFGAESVAIFSVFSGNYWRIVEE